MEWQPIETAPKDGEVFLTYWHDMPVFCAWVDDGFRVLMSVGGATPHLVVHGNFAPFTPSHWMPLPTPPEVK